MTEDLDALAAHRHAIHATIPLLGAIQSIAEMAFRTAERTVAPVTAYAEHVDALLDELLEALEPSARGALLGSAAGSSPSALLVIGSERGLCGAFNERVVRRAVQLLRPDTVIVCWGSRGERLLRAAGHTIALAAPLPLLAAPQYADIESMAVDILHLVEQRGLSRVVVVHNQPVRGFQYTSEGRQILPPEPKTPRPVRRPRLEVKPAADAAGLLFHQLTEHVLIELYRAVVQSAMSEQLARIATMRLAGENARKLLDDLTMEYNLARQHAITQSLLQIIAGYETSVANDR
jgi:F-type H+-transporting ATPase subunit gamma